MKVDEIFGSAWNTMVKDAMKHMKHVHGDVGADIEGVMKGGKMVPRSKMLGALADATSGAKKTMKAPTMPSGKIPK